MQACANWTSELSWEAQVYSKILLGSLFTESTGCGCSSGGSSGCGCDCGRGGGDGCGCGSAGELDSLVPPGVMNGSSVKRLRLAPLALRVTCHNMTCALGRGLLTDDVNLAQHCVCICLDHQKAATVGLRGGSDSSACGSIRGVPGVRGPGVFHSSALSGRRRSARGSAGRPGHDSWRLGDSWRWRMEGHSHPAIHLLQPDLHLLCAAQADVTRSVRCDTHPRKRGYIGFTSLQA